MLNVLEYLENSVRKSPQKTAFTDAQNEVTFEELSRRAMSIGTAIAQRTAEVNKPVAVIVDRRVSSLTAMMGVLYSGNYYVPVDNKMPIKRMRDVISQLDPELILYDEADEKVISVLYDAYDVMLIADAVQEKQNAQELTARRARVLDIDPAYIIHTSGSTGLPKGIVVSHKNVIDLTEWLCEACSLTTECIVGNQTPFFFDASVKDIYSTLRNAATMHILPTQLFSFPVKLMEYIEEKHINTLPWATSAFNLVANSGVLKEHAPYRVRKLIIGGEALLARNLNIWRKALSRAVFINVYGPTEATVDSAYYIVDRNFEDHEAVPIGRACKNMEIMLLDENQKPVKQGEKGEIYIRGTGVAKGYFKDPERTKKSFVQNPLNNDYPEIIYKTGDIALENSEGLLVYQSRVDGQIKHMGYRIEIGEVERAITSAAGVCEAVCVFDEDKDKLVCFYIGEAESLDIMKTVLDIIPKYMCPNVWEKAEIFPKTANGKIDRRQLKQDYLARSATK